MKRTDKNHHNDTEETNESSRFQSFLYYFDIFYRVVKSLIIIFVVILLIGGALGAGAGLGYFASLVHDTEIPEQEVMAEQINDYNEKSTMYYAGGEIISDLRSDLLRTPVSLDEISPFLVEALVATEDEYFFDHEGVVPKAVARALIQDLTETGSTGGSTLTQQLIKQQIVGGEVSHERKANEILLAMRLENHMDKDEILEAYLNVSPFGRNNKGQNIAGVEEAAQGIFGVPATDVTLPQAAFIAGLPQRPIVYSPYTQFGEIKENHNLSIERQREVLFRMYREGYITYEEYEDALAYDITQDFISREEADDEDGRSYIYDLAEKEAKNLLLRQYLEDDGVTREMLDENPELLTEYNERADYDIRNRGYHIYTTIDRSIHYALERVVEETQNELGADKTVTVTNDDGSTETKTLPVQTSSVLIDNQTGRVIAFVGGRDYEENEVNHAFSMNRSPGSTIKPLAVFGPALEYGVITPATIIPDTEFEVPDQIVDGEMVYHTVGNYTGTSGEWMTARQALYESQNIPATKIHMAIKDDYNPSEFIRRMGIGEDVIADYEFSYPTFAIGGVDDGPTPVQLISAFSTIGNNGKHVDPYVIDRIETSAGDVVYENETVETEVWSPETNYMLLDMLRQTHTDGTARGTMNQLPFEADWVSKTGTTQNYNDVWYIASTPRISFGTWMGYGVSTSLEFDYGIHPSRRNRNMWARLVNAIYQENPDLLGIGETYPRPDGITTDSVIQATGMKAGTVETPDGSTFSYSGPTHSELFASDRVPGPTVYDFALGASDEELEEFWDSRTGSQSEEDEEDEDSNDDTAEPDSSSDEPDEPEEPSSTENDSSSNENSNGNGNNNGNDNNNGNSNGNDNSNDNDNNNNNDNGNGNGNANGNGNGNPDDGDNSNGNGNGNSNGNDNGNGNGNDDEEDEPADENGNGDDE